MPFITSPNTLNTDRCRLKRKWGQSQMQQIWSWLRHNSFPSNSGAIWVRLRGLKRHCKWQNTLLNGLVKASDESLRVLSIILKRTEMSVKIDNKSAAFGGSEKILSAEQHTNQNVHKTNLRLLQWWTILCLNSIFGSWGVMWLCCDIQPLTFGAEWPIEGSGGTVTQIAVIPLHTLPPIPAVHPKTGTVTLATGLHPRCDFGPLLQVEGDAVHP